MGGDRQEMQMNRVWEDSNFLKQPYGREHTLNFRLIYKAMFQTGGLGRGDTETKEPGLPNSFSSSGQLFFYE